MKKCFLLASALLFAVAVSNGQATNSLTATPAQSDAKPENKNQADFKFEALEFNYGTIKQGESVSYNFKFTNIGKEPLVITSANGSCGCTVPEWPKEPIKKGEKGEIKVTFNSAGKMGPQDKTVTINSNAKTNPIILHIKGNVEKAAEAPANPPQDAH